MDKFMNWLQAKVIPPMEKLGSNKYLVAIRNGLVLHYLP